MVILVTFLCPQSPHPNSGVSIIFGLPGKHSLHSLITVLIHNSGHFGPPLPFWAPGIAGAADG